MALLVEGLEVGGETSIEEYIIGPGDELSGEQETGPVEEHIKLYGPGEGLSWIAKPVGQGNSTLGIGSRQGSLTNSNIPLMDPLVTLFGSVHERLPESGSMKSMLFPNFGSMLSTVEPRQWDEESPHPVDPDRYGSGSEGGSENELLSPLISRQETQDREGAHGSMRENGGMAAGEGIGGGWQLAWRWTEEDKGKGGFKRVYLHEGAPGSRRGSVISIPGGDVPEEGGDVVKAAALVSRSALYSKGISDQGPVGPAMVHPSKTAEKGPVWGALLEPGVKHALVVGMGIQILQQFSGINGVLYYTPQILEEAGVSVLLSNLGLGSDSASFLISAFTTFLMLPCIGIAMWLMDISGRRSLLLRTIPVLIVSLAILVVGDLVSMGSVAHAIISTACVITYFCCFVTAYGPIPNILCAEIFPTRVRGVCIAICALVFWIGDIIVTYTLPLMLASLGLSGVFGIYAVMCAVSLLFVFLKVPETKGMPLEVITDFFSVGAKQIAASKD